MSICSEFLYLFVLWAFSPSAVKLMKMFSWFARAFSICMCFLKLQRVELSRPPYKTRGVAPLLPCLPRTRVERRGMTWQQYRTHCIYYLQWMRTVKWCPGILLMYRCTTCSRCFWHERQTDLPNYYKRCNTSSVVNPKLLRLCRHVGQIVSIQM